MIDIHCHLLPGIDDGSKNLQQSLQMARLAVADGITHAILTPHIQPGRWDNSAVIIARETKIFRSALEKNKIPLHIGYAAEVRLSDEIFQQLEGGKIPFLGKLDGFNIILLEFPHTHIIPGSEKLIDWLIRNNIRPLIAHPERNREIMAKPEKLKPFLDQGCLAQVTAASLVGRFGDNARNAARFFIKENQIDFLASDAHNLTTRAPAMAEAMKLIANSVGEELAKKLAYDMPLKLVSQQFENPDDQ